MKLTLPNGTTGYYNEWFEWVCTGSQMGRRNCLPEDTQAKAKLHLVRLPFVDGCYDRWGAYWGAPSNVYIATNRACVDGAYKANGEGQLVELFVRADSRDEARQKVREQMPNARFYR